MTKTKNKNPITLATLLGLTLLLGAFAIPQLFSRNILPWPPQLTPNLTLSEAGFNDIVIQARGTNGKEKIALYVNNQPVKFWNLTNTFKDYTYTPNGEITVSELSIHFLNDTWEPENNINYDVQIPFITVNGTKYSSEHASTVSTGSWDQEDWCAPGNKKTQWLNCTGSFTYNIPIGTVVGVPVVDPEPTNNPTLITPTGETDSTYTVQWTDANAPAGRRYDIWVDGVDQGPSLIAPKNSLTVNFLTGGSHTIVLKWWDNDDFETVQETSIEIISKVPPVPICGNSKVEQGEQCDDGNTKDGDGCNSQCYKEGGGDNAPYPDTEYGATVVSSSPPSSCPKIPRSFPKTYTVTSLSQFTSAYNQMKAGEAIIIKNGTYSWGTITLGRTIGTKEKPLYILAERLHEVNFGSNWEITGQNHVIAGLRTQGRFTISGQNNRVACNYFKDAGVIVSGLGPPKGNSSGAEIDNNIIDGNKPNNPPMGFQRCDQRASNCTSNIKNIHIHHNTFKNKPKETSNVNEAIMFGLGWKTAPGVKNYNKDGTHTDSIIENNFFDNWKGENELVSLKTGHNIIRNNCVTASSYGNFKNRSGDHNLYTGNWTESARFEMAGVNNFYAFNYVSASSFTDVGIRLSTGQIRPDSPAQYKGLYAYWEASDNTFTHNVFNNFKGLISVHDQLGSSYKITEIPSRNLITNNVIHSTRYDGSATAGGYYNRDGKTSESQFRNANDWRAQTVVSRDLADVSCGNKALFNGPGGSGASVPATPGLLGNPSTISAPSWW